MKTLCDNCEKDLSTVKEIHASQGHLFCSKDCAVDYYVNEIILNAKEGAKAMYNDFAEVVTPEDIGIVHEKVFTVYSNEYDVTTIFKSTYLDAECTETTSTEVIGFYWGRPNDEDTEVYTGTLKATY